jgi:hypothetical protein
MCVADFRTALNNLSWNNTTALATAGILDLAGALSLNTKKVAETLAATIKDSSSLATSNAAAEKIAGKARDDSLLGFEGILEVLSACGAKGCIVLDRFEEAGVSTRAAVTSLVRDILRIPEEKDHLFRRKEIGCSGAIRSLGVCRSEATRVIQLWLDFSSLFWAGSSLGFSSFSHGFSFEGDGVGVVDEPV